MNTFFSMSSNLSKPAALYLREEGQGATVVCLHSSTSSQAQWRGLVNQLGEHWQTMAVDLHGHGRSPAWPAITPNTLEVDALAVIDAVRRAGPAPEGIHLVAHSYGAAVALQIALDPTPARPQSLVNLIRRHLRHVSRQVPVQLHNVRQRLARSSNNAVRKRGHVELRLPHT